MYTNKITSVMNRQIITTSSIVVAALVLIMGIPSSAYAINGHGVTYGPTFGGLYKNSQVSSTQFQYNDGLKINSNTYDVSKPSVTWSTPQTLYIGAQNKITVKIYENGGPYYIMGGAILLNAKGTEPAASASDTWIQWDKFGGVSVRDPHNMLGNVQVTTKDDQHFKWVTFTFTPKSPMSTSDLILEAWDLNLSVGTAIVINALNISYVPQGYH